MAKKTSFSIVIKYMDDVPLKQALALREAISRTIKSAGYEVYGEGYDLKTKYLDIGFVEKTYNQDKPE